MRVEKLVPVDFWNHIFGPWMALLCPKYFFFAGIGKISYACLGGGWWVVGDDDDEVFIKGGCGGRSPPQRMGDPIQPRPFCRYRNRSLSA